MRRSNNGLWSGILAAAVFLITFIVVGVGFPVSLLLAVLSFVAGWFLLPTKKREGLAAEAELKDALAEGRDKLARIRSLGKSVSKPGMAANLGDVCSVIDKILTTIAEDPKKLNSAKQFLNYYLDATVKIMTMYGELASKDVHDADIQVSLSKVEAMLGTIKDAFEKQLAQLLSGETMDLNTELSLLQQTFNMEGLGKNP